VIDTLGLRLVVGGAMGSAEVSALRAAATGAVVVTGVDAGDGDRSCSWAAKVPVLGQVKLTAGGQLYMMRSLSKVRQELDGVAPKFASNGLVLSGRAASQTFQDWVTEARSRLPFLAQAACDVRRADVCYDRVVPDTMAVLRALEGAMVPTRKGCSWFDNGAGAATGLMLMGRAVAHRVYNKGLELKDSSYNDVLRSEEQLRATSAGLRTICDQRAMSFDREACVEIMNERYLESGCGEVVRVDDLVESGAWAQVALTLNPELLECYKRSVRKSSYYEMRRKVRARRAQAVPVDLRVPADAWMETAA